MSTQSFARIGYNNAQGDFVPKLVRAQDVRDTTGVSTEAHQTNAAIHLTSTQAQLIANAIQNAALGAANGVATLDANAQLTLSQLPASVTGGLTYQGRFDAATGLDGGGNPIPAPAPANKGWFWIASVAGEFTPPGASVSIDFAIGDWIVSSGAVYDKICNSTVDIIARTAANNAMTEAQLLDAAYCVDETDMANKNLRAGAVVLMEVDNTTVDPED
jgi:hypothetical protein